MEFSTNRFKKLSGLLKEDYGTEEGPFMPQQKSKRLLSIAYATALCKKHGHVSLGQIKYLLKKKEALDVKEEHIFDYLMVSGKFNRLQSASDKHMGMPVFGMKESKIYEVEMDNSVDLKQIAFSELSDAYKEANGFRPRGVFDYEKMSLEDIEQAIQHYSSLPGAYDDFDFAAEDEHTKHMDMLWGFEDADEQAIKDLGHDDEYDLMPKQSGMKMKQESIIENENLDIVPTPPKSKKLLATGYAVALCKKYGHASLGQISYLLKKNDGIEIPPEQLHYLLAGTGKFTKTNFPYNSVDPEVFQLKNPEITEQNNIMSEDWDNYTSVEEIEAKYLQKLMLAMGLSTSDARLPQVQEIFKTALKDAETLGQTKSGSTEPPTGV